ncbi:hypothetical protein ABB37_00433 [Leptomonas pyrrhocoris]|uniref:Autophagy-related protein 2 n=1 Tax=Leptomonas pyrrhocoris TaxID=157538 RepID=A0A0N0E098_LEPPY|nr:hypothetical protein ABB37_00433 [Leptomonas pyrrhocoris]KPA86188.1 hypothetical protein ABB37_00433 [Leptomonas pyrrhocoris]|eukprot:XP_015664627.1 hypothetical protein ABB37_00433 [Leptomonas pyrrhocoris]
MNLVNTYLLLPLQRKIFKNFGHYDYRTNTFHLNEERVNEVFFDPAFNPFVDVLRETSHASAIASAKSTVHHPASPSATRQVNQAGQEAETRRSSGPPSPAPPMQNANCTGADSDNTRETQRTQEDLPQTNRAPPTSPQGQLPRVQLLEGKVRSAGLVSFLRQVTALKSLAVESIDLIFSVAAATSEERKDAVSASLSAARGADDTSSPTPQRVDEMANADDASPTSAPWQDGDEPTTAAAMMARSYSLEDQFTLFHSQQQPRLGREATAAEAAGSSPSAVSHPSPTTAPGLSSSPFHTVGDLMNYLKNQLQGLTVGVEEVRLTFCVPPAPHASRSTTASGSSQNTSSTGQRSSPSQTRATTPVMGRGTRVLHFTCRQGLRFTVDNAIGDAVQDMQCSTVVSDWQCYLRVMEEDGPVPTTFSLDELVMTTTAHVGAASAANTTTATTRKDDGTQAEAPVAESAPITVHLARQSASLRPNSGASSPAPSPPAMEPPRILLDVEATGGWSVVLTATQVAHLIDMAYLITAAAPFPMESNGKASKPVENEPPTTPSSISQRWAADVTDALRQEVETAPLESVEAMAAAAIAATQLQAAAKYVCVHSAGCSITLLTRSAVEPGVVARAWSGALSPQQLSLLRTAEDTHDEAARVSSSRRPVFDALASPHFTYVMRDMDFLFPNVESRAAPSTALSRVFAADRKKRAIYRNLFKNDLADPAVTEQLTRAQQRGFYNGAQSFFLGIGSIALLEYREAASRKTSENADSPNAFQLLRPAQLLHAARSPYAFVVLHRSTQPLLEKAGRSSPLSHRARADETAQTPSPSAPPQLCAHQETVVVGLASISVELDPELLEVLTSYVMTLATLTQSMTRAAVLTKSTPKPASRVASPLPPSLQHISPTGTQTVANRSSVKVLLESLEASVRFPLHPLTIHDDLITGVPASRPSSPPTVPLVTLPCLLARLLQRLRETSLHTHRKLRSELVQLARIESDAAPHRTSTDEVDTTVPSTAADQARSFAAVQEKLGFPEDVYGTARFLPEVLRFSVRDLQLVETQSSCGASQSNEITSVPTDTLHQPLCTSVKWREAVVYMHDVLEGTKSELFRGDYTPEMSIRITHARLPDEAALHRWHALRHVLTLQIRLGDVTTTVLTQDDFLLASFYVQELLRTLAHCRQRLHGLFDGYEEAATEGAPSIPSAEAEANGSSAALPDASAQTTYETTHETTDESAGEAPSSGLRLHSADLVGGTVAEAFAMADVHKAAAAAATSPTTKPAYAADTAQDAQSTSSSLLQKYSEWLHLVPDLWYSVESTCTALDVQIGRVRVGLFAPRLSPMGDVVGEPLFRCLPAAQRRQMVDLNCLYHTYIIELVGVSMRGLLGNGALVGKGHDAYLHARFGGCSMWERHPLALSTSSGERGRGAGPGGGGGGATAAAAATSSLYSSYVSGVMHPPSTSSPPRGTADLLQQSSTITSNGSNNSSSNMRGGDGAAVGNGPGLRRDLGYYLSNQQHRGSTLVQLIQSYTEACATTDGDGEEGEREELLAVVDTKRGAVRGALGRDERFLYQLWSTYIEELKRRLSDGAQTSTGKLNTVCADLDVGVCAVRVLEHVAGEQEAQTQPSTDARAFRDTRSITIQLAGLGLRHIVAYNGDHLAAVLQNYFSAGDRIIPNTAADVAAPLANQTAEFAKNSRRSSRETATAIHLELNNLMATYRPRGVGRSLAAVLLPRASVLVNAPAWTPLPMKKDLGKSAHGKETGESVAQLPLAMQAQAWLHTSVPIYVCNDCDVEALAREVLDPTESDDWGVDLEGAGFVRLCEVISTAPVLTDNDAVSARLQRYPVKRRPNLTVTLPQSDAATALQDADEISSSNDNNFTADGDGGSAADRESAVAVRVRYVELSAFMAKDAFDVFRELAETWGAGSDLQVLDTPAALVMRSGPGFDWVAGEVARSCAPMTFQLNPALTSALAREKGTPALVGRVEGSAQLMTEAESATSAAPHQCFPPRPSSFSPLCDVHDAMLSAGSASASAEVSSTLPTYGYSTWRDALHAAQGRDQRLSEAYQTRVAELLDKESPWVPVHRFAQQSKDDVASAVADAAMVPLSSQDAIFFPSDECEDEQKAEELDTAVPSGLSQRGGNAATPHAYAPVAPPPASTAVLSVSSSFSDLGELETNLAPLQWHVMPCTDPNAAFSETVRRIPAAALVGGGVKVAVDDDVDDADVNGDFDLCAACERQPHFLSCWSRDRADAASQSCPVSFNHLERTDDALLHDTTEKYLYPPVELQFFLCDCAVNVSLYEGTDLMAAAVRKQRQGYLQIVSRGARVTQAAVPYSMVSPHDEHRKDVSERDRKHGKAEVTAKQRSAHLEPSTYPSTSAAAATTTIPLSSLEPPSESSASRLSRLNNRGCRSGFGDRDASKRLVLVSRGITVQCNTFSQASEEDLWFHVVVGEATVFDCIETSDVHRLLTATPQTTSASARFPAGAAATAANMSRPRVQTPQMQESHLRVDGDSKGARQLELTGLLTSSKSLHMAAARHDVAGDTRASFTVSRFQQGGSELSLVVRMQPTSLTWSGASMDFAQSFLFSSSSSSPTLPSPAAPSGSGAAAGGNVGVSDASLRAGALGATGTGSAASTSANIGVLSTDDGVISGTEAPPIFFRRVVILPTTLTVAGSFQSDKGVLAALAEGKSLDALRSVPVLSWISVQEIPLPIPFMRIEDCSSAVTLLQRIVEDTNCVSIRFLLTALCCGLQPLSAVARVGEAARGLLLLPLSQYRGAALHHAIRTASSVFMQELLAQTSGVAALLASGSYHASRSLLEALISPSDRRRAITAEPSRASQPAGLGDGWRQGQEQLRTGVEEALTMASYCTGPDGSLLRLPAAALRMLMGISGAATTTLWGVRNSQSSAARDRDGYIYKK